jgi:hypothetical protein
VSYYRVATTGTPALVIYLLDVSGSMSSPINHSSRIEVVTEALRKLLVRMIQRSTKGTIVAPRYRIAMFAYSSQVIDLVGGVRTVDEVARMGVPRLTTLDISNTAGAFLEVEKLLEAELPNLQNCPVPIICHMTDGEYAGEDPEPIAKRIMNMSIPDGNVLIENIFIREGILRESIDDIRHWQGITSADQLTDQYARKLYNMSSVLPDNYVTTLSQMGFHFARNARMMIPGIESDLVDFGFTMSGATPIVSDKE